MKTCIIAGGMLEREFALRFIQEQNFDIILAADRGLEFCSQENIRPTYILGDFDSLKEGVLDKYKEERDIPIREFNPVKDNTDMDLALGKQRDPYPGRNRGTSGSFFQHGTESEEGLAETHSGLPCGFQESDYAAL